MIKNQDACHFDRREKSLCIVISVDQDFPHSLGMTLMNRVTISSSGKNDQRYLAFYRG